jgi:hypothetical protein
VAVFPTYLLCCDFYLVPEFGVACKMIFGPKRQNNINYKNNLDRYMQNIDRNTQINISMRLSLM